MGAPLKTKTRAGISRDFVTRPTVKIDGIEVTQTIQNMAHDVPLIAKKSTVVRVYVTLKSAGGIPKFSQAKLSSEISVRRHSTGSATKVVSFNALVGAQSGTLASRRKNLKLSLNFILPSVLRTAGRLYLEVSSLTLRIPGFPLPMVLPVPAHPVRQVKLLESPPLRVRIFHVRYTTGTPAQSYEPTARDFQMIASWLRRAYPVPEVIVSQATIEATATWPFLCGDVNAQLTAIRGQDMAHGGDRRTHYFGAVADGAGFMRGCASGVPQSPDPSTVASGPVGSADWGWDTDGCYGDWYTGHELGHTFGRKHPGFCGETTDDLAAYPFPNGQLSASNDEFVGFDFGDAALGLPMSVMPGVDWHDVMTYCQRQWLSSYTYMGIRNRLIAEENMGAVPQGATRKAGRRAPAAAAGLIQAVARVNTVTGQGKFVFVQPLALGAVLGPAARGAVLLRALDAGGKKLAEYRVAPKYDTCQEGGPGGNATIDAIFPKPAGLAALELLVGGKLVDTFRPAPATTRSLKAKASASPRSAPELRYTVQTSVDEGKTWETQAVGLRTPKFILSPENFGAAAVVKMRVIATNGFESTVLSTEDVPL